MTRTRKPPLRTCIGCGKGADKRDMLRIVRSPDGHVTLDATGKANGRGAYVHDKNECMDTAISRRKFDSALRVRLLDDDIDRLRREFSEASGSAGATQRGE